VNNCYVHLSTKAYLDAVCCNPNRLYGFIASPAAKRRGNPAYKKTVRKVSILLHKRSLGLKIAAAANIAGWSSDIPARVLLKKLGWNNDRPRRADSEKSAVIAAYLADTPITEIARRYGVPTTTIFRWVQESGNAQSFSSRKALFSSLRPCGSLRTGKKGLFHTRKGGAWIPTDSTYEYARLEQHDEDESVAKVERCYQRVPYIFAGKQRYYVPDFQVTFTDGSVCVEEVKPDRWRNDPIVVAKACAATAFFSQLGHDFKIVTEDDIGHDRIKSCADAIHSREEPEYKSQREERRRLQKRTAQRTYLAKKRLASG